jgi:CRP/FNR family transcriptional regulator, nitrogen oxide reductase regulator
MIEAGQMPSRRAKGHARLQRPGHQRQSVIGQGWLTKQTGIQRPGDLDDLMDQRFLSESSIQAADVFSGLTSEQLTQLRHSGQKVKLPPKVVLFRQGDPAEKCYLVERGRLKLAKLNEAGKEAILRYISAGEATAAVAVLKNREYPVTAETVEKTEVTGWEKPTFLRFLHAHPEIAINMLGVVLDRLEEVQQRYLQLCSEGVEQRIARSLLRLMQRAGSPSADGILIELPLSRQSIADYSGTTLYTASRTLSSWEKNGWIKSKRQRVLIADPHALVTFAEGG